MSEGASGKRRRVISSKLRRAGGSGGDGGQSSRRVATLSRLAALENDNAMADAAAEMKSDYDLDYEEDDMWNGSGSDSDSEDEEVIVTPEEMAAMGPCFTGRRREDGTWTMTKEKGKHKGQKKGKGKRGSGSGRGAGKRRTRASGDKIEAKMRKRNVRSFAALLEESGLEQEVKRMKNNKNFGIGDGKYVQICPPASASASDSLATTFNYLTAAALPSRFSAPRKFCSVCGFASTYTCAQCGAATVCSKKCLAAHSETRCLKFVVQ